MHDNGQFKEKKQDNFLPPIYWRMVKMEVELHPFLIPLLDGHVSSVSRYRPPLLCQKVSRYKFNRRVGETPKTVRRFKTEKYFTIGQNRTAHPCASSRVRSRYAERTVSSKITGLSTDKVKEYLTFRRLMSTKFDVPHR